MKLPEGWQEALLAEMERRFSISQEKGRLHEDALSIDDTQLGVEFAIDFINSILAAATPTPAAQEDEIAEYQVWHPDIPRWTNCSKLAAENLAQKPEFKIRPVYTRPADDKLRRAIGEHLAFVHRDGGHHREKVGDIQAIEDATRMVIADRLQLIKMEFLRKAAEELVQWYNRIESGNSVHAITLMHNLRAVLEGKS